MPQRVSEPGVNEIVQGEITMYDGDQISMKPVFTEEANRDCEERIKSKGYVLNVSGKFMREMGKDFILCAYELTKSKDTELPDINASKPMYVI